VKTRNCRWQFTAGGISAAAVAALVVLLATARAALAGFPWWPWHHHAETGPGCACPDGHAGPEGEGTWYWLRSPDEEKRVVAGLYNRYCVRCHAIDGRGVWDIPGVPDFTDARWQACRSDAQIAHIILEGRGAVMPPFRGTLTLEEAWAMARYLRTFLPGSETSRQDRGETKDQRDEQKDQREQKPEMAPQPRKQGRLPEASLSREPPG
jgi:hypothetical protein